MTETYIVFITYQRAMPDYPGHHLALVHADTTEEAFREVEDNMSVGDQRRITHRRIIKLEDMKLA